LQFITFFKQLKSINLPTGWNCIQNETTLIFFSMKIQNDDIPKATVEKQIIILHNFQVSCYALNVELKPSNFNLKSFEVGLNNVEEVVNLLMLFDKKSICIGGPKAINFSGKYLVFYFYLIQCHQNYYQVLPYLLNYFYF